MSWGLGFLGGAVAGWLLNCWWRSFVYYWGPAILGNPQQSSDRISDKGPRQ